MMFALSRSAADLLGGIGRWHRPAGPGCRAARPDVGPDAFGPGRDADALEHCAAWWARATGRARCRTGTALGARTRRSDGLRFTPPPGFHGNFTLILDAASEGAATSRADDHDHRRSLPGDDHGRQRPRLAAAGDPRFQRRDRRDEHDRLRHPGSGVQTILPLSPLPAITNPVLIDGFSQPGYAGTPLIELSGSQAGIADGLTITGSGVTVRGLDIDSFAEGAGILITGPGATGNTIEANDIGTDPTGSQALPNDYGVQILAAPATTSIGGTTAAAGNLIAFNTGPGVDVEGDSSVGNQITANRIFAQRRRPCPVRRGPCSSTARTTSACPTA